MKLLSDQVSEKEISIILRELEKTNNIEGDVCEFGCFVGTTSVFLAHSIANSSKTLWLYDSFEGLPEKTDKDKNSLGESFKKGELHATKKQLIQNLRRSNIERMPKITKCWFNELDHSRIPKKISFAFLDGDYYESIKHPLALIWDNLSPGAIVVVDDYGNQALPGAQKAVEEWCLEKDLQFRVEESLAIINKK